MILDASKRSFLSILLVVSILISASGISAQASVTKEDAKKYIKWGTIGGVAIGAVIGAATFGIGGLIIGGAIGALTTSIICDRLGVSPKEQWKQVFPNFKLPFTYNRQNQAGSNGASLPVNGPSTALSTSQDSSFAERVKNTYQKSYQNYTEAVQKSKDSGLIRKALEAYQKAKIEFDKLK